MVRPAIAASLTALLILAGCSQGGAGAPTPIEGPPSPPAPQGNEVSPSLAPDTALPSPFPPAEASQEGQIRGVLVDSSTQQGIEAIELVLIPIDSETGEFGVPMMPSVTTDAQGAFLFGNIPPGQYSVFSMTWKSSWDDQFGNMHKFEVQPGQTTDLGPIEVDH